MAFVPKYGAVFEEPIIDNVLAFVERDFKLALDHFYPTLDLADFAERSLDEAVGLEFPVFVIAPSDNDIEIVDDDSHLIEPQRFDVEIVVSDESPAKVLRRCMKYVRALDAVLRSASQADYFVGMTDAFDLQVEVTHSYGPRGKNDRGSYCRFATLQLSVSLRELA